MSVRIVERSEIEAALDAAEAREMIAAGFAAYSDGRATVPPVGELLFDDPPGEAHIKYGAIAGEPYFVIKVATGFYQNARHGVPNQDGLMLVHRCATGELVAILLDRGWLTAVRTALAGAIAAAVLAPEHVRAIGVAGTGEQAQMQVEYLRGIVDCRSIVVWGRSSESRRRYAERMTARGYDVRAVADAADLADCQLIVTATPSRTPLLTRLAPGTHVTAVGADTPDKNEIAPQLFARADRVVADSRVQCAARGELKHALAAKAITLDRVSELGELVLGRARGRRDEREITIADLTGVAVQDIQIASHVLQRLGSAQPSAKSERQR